MSPDAEYVNYRDGRINNQLNDVLDYIKNKNGKYAPGFHNGGGGILYKNLK